MKLRLTLALFALASPAFAQSLPTPNYGCGMQINGVTVGCPAAVAVGGTGGATPSAARSALGAAASGANTDILSLGGLTTPLSVGQGGTGGSTAPAARASLGVASAGTKGTGTSVADPGTGNLEMLLPVQTVTGASRTFASGDLFQETRRSNSGSAMSDTFPAVGTTGLVNGARMFVNNVDATSSDTITAGSGTTINGGASVVLGPLRSSYWIYDAPSTTWRTTSNSLSALLCGTSGVTGLVKGNGLAACTAAVAGTDYAPATSGSGILKGNGSGGFSAVVAGTDYVAPGGSAGAIDVTTQAVDTNTTKAASTAFVIGQAASATPLVDGTATVGTSTRYARGDHVHPTDTTRTPTTRTITAGTGLSGGGDLSADRTISLSTPVSVANGGTNYAGGAWTAYTPVLTANTNTLGGTSGASGAYIQIGKIVFFHGNVTITTNGTGTNSLNFTLPVAAKANQPINGVLTGGGTVQGATDGTANLFVVGPTGGYPGANSTTYSFGGSYEAS